MPRSLLLLTTIVALGACDVTEPNVVACDDDCPDVSRAGRAGSSDDAGSAGQGGAAGRDAASAGSGAGGLGGTTAGSGGAQDAAAGSDGAAGTVIDAGGGEDASSCGSCPPDLPHCADTTCVGCLQDGDCPQGVCEQNACVQCRENTDCTDPAAPRCAQHTCMPCSQSVECVHIEGKPVCDGSTCVQCTGLDFNACGRAQDGTRYVCDALARTCTTHKLRSGGLCDPCVSDAQCGAGQLCVMQYFDEVGDDPDQGELEVGHYCFWRQDATEAGAPSGDCVNVRPYVDTRADTESIEGVEATVCGLRVTTCSGYKDYSAKGCAGLEDDLSCGDLRFAGDAYCEMFSASTYRCTTPCLSSDDCDVGTTCTASAPKYCALQ